jgi:DNA ligase (NAD+)
MLNQLLEAPQKCPSCNTELILSKTQTDLFCPNSDNCPAQVLGRLTYFTQRNIGNITGLSEKNLEKFINELNVTDIPDLFTIDWDLVVRWDGFGKQSVTNLFNSIQKTKEGLKDYRFIAGLGIDGVGIEVAKLIASEIAKKANS